MSQEIQYTVEFTVKPGSLDAFKSKASEIIESVRANEPDIRGYQWYFNDDESKCYVAEWHSSSESLMAHLANVGETLPQLLEFSDITRFEAYGNPNEQAAEALKSFGVVAHGFFDGFTR